MTRQPYDSVAKTVGQVLLAPLGRCTDQSLEALRTRLVVVPQLSPGKESLYLRLMGKGSTLRRAIEELSELQALDEEARNLFGALLGFFRRIEEKTVRIRSEREVEFMENARDIFRQTELAKEIRAQGQLEGRVETVLKQLRLKYEDAVTEPVEAKVRAASVEQLERYAERVLTEDSLEATLRDD